MKKTSFLWMLLWSMVLFAASCQKVVLSDEDEPKKPKGGVSLQFNVAQFEQIPFNAAKLSRATDVKQVCNRIQLAVYKNGVKVNQLNQVATDADFGSLKLSLAPGTYKIAVLAHSGAKNAVMTNLQKMTFDGKVTDTFYYCDDITVSEEASYNLVLRRAVAMFRLVATDAVPAEITLMRFYYTGGSSSFDAVRGVGCVESRQSESREVTAAARAGQSVYEIYTFPRSDNNVLKVQVTAHDGESNVRVEKVFEGVQVERNRITQYTGNFFGESGTVGEIGTNAISLNLTSEDEWTLTDHVY